MSDIEREVKTPATRPTKPAIKSPFNPYDLVIIGFDDHPGIAADTKASAELGITVKDAERRRKLYVQLYDERGMLPVDPGMLASIRAYRILEPIKYIVFDGVPYTINGRQRIKGARAYYDEQVKLGIEPEHLITVPGERYTGDIDELFAMSRVLNIHVDEPPMMKARSMQRLLMEELLDPEDGKAHKRTVGQVAAIYACSDQHVRDMTALFASSDTVKKALEVLKQPTIGLLLTGLKKDDGSPDEEAQIRVLGELAEVKGSGGKITVDKARKAVQEAKGKTVNSPKDKVDSAMKLLTKLADIREDQPSLPGAVLTLLDGLVRTMWGGTKGVTFPTPINKQVPGYTLDIIANLGD